MNKFALKSILLVCLSIFFATCVKDTDFDQTENIVGTPIIELNLIYFNLRTDDFFDSINSTPIFTLRDTTELKFLNDGTLQENLKRVEFYFKFTNSIPKTFQVDFQFLSELNDTTYVAETGVLPGSVSSPNITEFIDIIEDENILRLTKANKVVVSVTVPSAVAKSEGILNLKSKATYFIEY